MTKISALNVVLRARESKLRQIGTFVSVNLTLAISAKS